MSAAYLAKRLVQALPTLLLVAVIVFLAVRLTPGDPALVKLGPYGAKTPEQLEAVRESMGLDKPILVQFAIWLRDVLKGDMGLSLRNGRPALRLVVDRLPASLELIGASLLFGLLVGVPVGVFAATRRGKWVDRALSAGALLGMATPPFWLALLLIGLFSVELRWLPASGYVAITENPVLNLRLLALPVVALGLFETANVARFVRSGMVRALDSDFVRTARAKGLAERTVLYKHALRNTLVTVVTVVGLEMGTLLSGTVIVEQVFGWSGLGWLSLQALNMRDYPVVQASVLLVAVLMVLINLIVDLVYGLVDPRVRVEARGL
ncbi:MAG: ABC transporter permease [Bacillota bacterium]